jgi:hypothetical protein
MSFVEPCPGIPLFIYYRISLNFRNLEFGQSQRVGGNTKCSSRNFKHPWWHNMGPCADNRPGTQWYPQ